MSGSGSQEVTVDAVQDTINDDVLADCDEAGVDVAAVIEDTIDEYGSYKLHTIGRFAQSTLVRRLEAESASAVSGILMGSRDRHGKNWPRRHAIVRSTGDHIEASTWDGSIPTTDGREIEIPNGAAVNARVEHDAEYDSYSLKQLDDVTHLPHDDLASKVGSIAKRPGELSRDVEYETVAVRGEVAFVNPQTVFEDGEPNGDGPVLLEDENGQPKPHFEMVLSEEGNTRVRAHVERQRYATPFFQIEDFDMLVHDASEKFNTPQDQASLMADALRGREVVVVGNVNSFDQTRRDRGTVSYVDIGVNGIVEIPSGDVGQTASVTESEPEAGSEPEQESDQGSDSDSGSGSDHSSGDIEQVASDVEQYASLVGLDKSDLSVDVIRENTEIEAPDSVLSAAIDMVGGDGPEQSGDDESEPVDPDDPIEYLTDDETGQIGCPMDACLFSSSGEAGLYGHVMSEHMAGSDENPEDWVAANVGE